MHELTLFEFAWGLLAMCGYMPIAIPVMMVGKMLYDKIVDMLIGEDEPDVEESYDRATDKKTA